MHNFYSDTQTLPTMAMRETALTAKVGDEQSDADPTTTELCERVAELLGKEQAVFLPSGTMCNEIAIAVHCRPGDEIICERVSHIITAEGGGPAALAGTMMNPIDGENGTFTPDQARAAMRPESRYHPRSRLLSVEQTVNLAGGIVWPLSQLHAVAEAAKAQGLATHMDGARLMNAVVASGVPAAEHAKCYDTVWIDFTKGLGAPIGAALAGSSTFIAEAWRLKQRMGGAMRQSGIAAAMCLYALDHNIQRMANDHKLAAHVAEQIAAMPMVERVLPAHTNIVIFDIKSNGPDATEVAAALRQDDIRIGAFGPRRIRIVTHLDVDETSGTALVATLAKHLD
ncbi:MAG: threonine aldolase family protein [Pseudomonadota bacterium]